MESEKDPVAEKLKEADAKLPPAHILQEKYTQTYTTFSGADVQVLIDGEVYGTVTSVAWTQDRKGRYQGVISETVFDRPSFQPFPTNATALIRMENEYGNQYFLELSHFSILDKRISMGMDDIVIEAHYSFVGKGVKESGSYEQQST